MRDLASIEGAPANEELAQGYFDALPERARAFLDRLEAEAMTSSEHREKQLQARDTCRTQLQDAENRRDEFQRGVRDGNKEDLARLAVFEKRVGAARARFQAIESVPPPCANIDPAALMSRVFQAGSKPWREVRMDPPELRTGETLDDVVEIIRGKIEVARNRIRQIESAILPVDEIDAAIDHEVTRIVAAGEPRLDSLIIGAQAIDGSRLVQSSLDPPQTAILQSVPLLNPELILYCFRDQVANALKREAEARFDDFQKRGFEVIASADRPQTLREAEENRLILERQEAAILRQLDGERLAVRRSNMSFQAALEIE
jgi:hypothetical protein